MSHCLNDYASVIQFFTSACFALSFENVLAFSPLGKVQEKYNASLKNLYNQHDDCKTLNHIKNRYDRIIASEGKDNHISIMNGIGIRSLSGWFLFFALLALGVLFLANGDVAYFSSYGNFWFWLGMLLASFGVLFWGFLTFYVYICYCMNARCIKKKNDFIEKKVTENLTSKDQHKKLSQEQLWQYKLDELNNYFGRVFVQKLWHFLFHKENQITI